MDLTSLLQGPLGEQLIGGAAQKLGINSQQAQQGLAMAVPFLLKAMNKNSSDPQGASGLASALDRDHDGSILNDISGFIGNGDFTDGQGILNHVLGAKKANVQNAIGQSAGMDTNKAADLLAMAAPIVMGFLGKEKRTQGVSENGIGDLIGNMLSNGAQQNNSEMSMIEKMLDQDGDGSIVDDVVGLGSKLLGGFFNKK